MVDFVSGSKRLIAPGGRSERIGQVRSATRVIFLCPDLIELATADNHSRRFETQVYSVRYLDPGQRTK
jgi:hypothetical protein